MSSIHIPKCPDKKMPTFVKTKRAFLAPLPEETYNYFSQFSFQTIRGGGMTTYFKSIKS
jgi:hypothetical protein